MCGIFCSFDSEMMNYLAQINSVRGRYSHSISSFSLSDDNRVVLTSQHKDFGEYDSKGVYPKGLYFVGHVQAPTTSDRSIDAIHPAEDAIGNMLWHNGIIKSFDVARLQAEQHVAIKWDTRLLLNELAQDDYAHRLSKINGSFACVLFKDGKLYAFRNELSPLFADQDMNISSVKFEGSYSLQANKIHELDLINKRIIDTGLTFNTMENPYYFGDSND